MKQQLKHFWAQKNLIIGILAALLLVTTTALICSNDGRHGGRGYKDDTRGKMMMRGGYQEQGRDMMQAQMGEYMGADQMMQRAQSMPAGTMMPAPATTTVQ